jgi:uncharacterized membrane protein (UPF0127 family)
VKNANPVSRRAWLTTVFVGVALAAFTVAGCKRDTESTAVPKTVADYFAIKVGDKVVRMQLAVREDEMMRGLMERTNLGRDEGMLFVYAHPQRMSFWMRNTPTPLDIGFFDASGNLQEIYPMYPFDETSVSSHGTGLSFALEMNQGWFRENAVRPGAKLDLTALAAALKARGFEPFRFGLEQK